MKKTKVLLISTDDGNMAAGVKALSSCLIRKGFETTIVIMPGAFDSYRKFCWDELYALCGGVDLIGISSMTHGLEKAIEVKKKLQDVDIPIIIGGIHASLDPESLMRDFDLVCFGEGEDLIVTLAERISNKLSYDDIPGLWVKRGNAITRNPALPLRGDLNEYPFPDYDCSHQYIVEENHVVCLNPANPNHLGCDYFVVLGSRGCPHHCAYCSNQKLKLDFPWRKKVRHYSVDYIIRHLQEVNKRFPYINSFWLDDDTFFAKKLEEIEEFSQKYKKEIDKPFLVLISPWTFDEEKIKPLLNAGLNRLIMGIQSGSERVTRELYERNLSSKRMMEIVRTLHKYSSMEIWYDFIGMNPFENRDNLLETIRFIREIPPPFGIYNNNLAFYPGTKLYQKALAASMEVGRRIKHSESDIGYTILIKEKLRDKIFHLLLLLMAGRVTERRVGLLPRIFISDFFLNVLVMLDKRLRGLTDMIVAFVSRFFLYANWRKVIRKILSPKTIDRLKLIYRTIH